MPLCTLHLIELESTSAIGSFLAGLEAKPILVSRVLCWAIHPTASTAANSFLTSHAWTLLLVFEGASGELRSSAQNVVKTTWSITAGIPSSVLKSFRSDNASLLRPRDENIPQLTGALDNPDFKKDSQNLELSSDLYEWIKRYGNGRKDRGGAVSMLNLLAFNAGADMKASYQRYGQAFAKSAGIRRGGRAKIVGTVVAKDGDGDRYWDEVAIAHYPSAFHFADMAASDDYQEANHRWRLPALKDTCILATSEVRLEEEGIGMTGGAAQRPKL